MHKYPEEVGQYIRDHVVGTSTKKLTADLNREFYQKYKIEFTEAEVKPYKHNHKLKSGTKGGTPKGCSLVYPEGMETFIRSIASGRTSEEIAEAVNEKYGKGTITGKKVRVYKKNHGITTGVNTRFQKGHEPQNKGQKMSPEVYEKVKHTMFQKGHTPANKMEVGEFTHTTDGYLIRKVQEDGTQRERFEFVHRAVWEEHHGEIPKGKMVSFLDGDKDNCNIENLFLIDNETNLEMNRRELRFDEAELTKVGRNIAKLNISARNRKKERGELHGSSREQ